MQNEELKELLAKVVEQQNELLEQLRAEKKQKKDIWDRVTAIAPILSAAIIATIGAYFTYTYNLQQLKVQEIQTIERFIPHLIGTEKSKKAAILAINSLGNARLAARVASIFASEGTADALQSIAQNTEDSSDRALVREALMRTLDVLSQKYESNKTASNTIADTPEIAQSPSPDMADNLLKLARIYEQTGDHASADELSKRAQNLRKKPVASRPEEPVKPASEAQHAPAETSSSANDATRSVADVEPEKNL